MIGFSKGDVDGLIVIARHPARRTRIRQERRYIQSPWFGWGAGWFGWVKRCAGVAVRGRIVVVSSDDVIDIIIK